MLKCLDYYDEPLEVGDEITSVIIDEKIVDDEGIITRIYFNPENDTYYLNIKNTTGYLLYQRKAQNYTTIERYKKYNPLEYTYFLDLDYVDHWRYEIVLDHNTPLKIDLPSHFFMAVLYARYKTGVFDRYKFIPKFGFIVDDKITIQKEKVLDGEEKFLYKPTINGKTYQISLPFPYRIFKTKCELLTYLQELIKYFHEHQDDLALFNQNIPFQDNMLAQKFDNELMRKLKL